MSREEKNNYNRSEYIKPPQNTIQDISRYFLFRKIGKNVPNLENN